MPALRVRYQAHAALDFVMALCLASLSVDGDLRIELNANRTLDLQVLRLLHACMGWKDAEVASKLGALCRLVLLLADRMQFPDPALFWDNIAMIVHISAGIRRELLQEQSKLLIPQKSQQNMEIQWRETHQAQARANGAAHPQTKPGHVQQVSIC